MPRIYGKTWWIDVFEELDRAVDAAHLFRRICGLADGLGFPYCSYGARCPLPVLSGQTTIRVFDSYPLGWMKHYVRRDYIASDPTVAIGARSARPIVWSDRMFANARPLWSDAREHGLKIGIAQSSWTAFGVFGLLSLARSERSISDKELGNLTPRLQWLAESAHRKMQTFLFGGEMERPVALSAREVEVLRWTAEGKTAWEISAILGISESTVAFHLRNAISKLGCQTKVQAVARATALGLIFSLDIQHPSPIDELVDGRELSSKAR